MKLLYPGHNYLGPGNELDNGEPVDRADEIAQLHDYQYENARSEFDVHKADIEAIGKFGFENAKHGGFSLPNLAGASGLLLKKFLEYKSGSVLYPLDQNKYVKAADSINKFFGGDSFLPDPNRPHVSMPDNKKRKHEESGGSDTSNGEGTSEQKPQAGSSMPGGTGSDVMATIIKNPHLPDTSFYFKKTFQIYTGGFQFNAVDPNAYFITPEEQNLFTTGTIMYITPLACLDPGMLPLYMTQSEYTNLPEFTYAKACRIKVTPLGYRLPFQTNESSAGYANSQTLVQCAHAVGLNTMYNCTLTNYAIDPADPTLVSTTIGDEPDYYGLLYGSEEEPIGANMGKPVHLNMYTALFQPGSTDTTPSFASINLLDNMSVQNVNDCKGTPLIDYKHEFKNGLLKASANAFSGPRTIVAPTGGGFNYQMSEGVNQTRYNTWSNAPNDIGTNSSFNELNTARTTGFNVSYGQTIEKSYFLQNQIAQHQTPDYSPLLHFGCLPVPSNFALAATETFAAAVIQWQIECELLCDVNLNSTSPAQQNPYLKKWDPIYLDPTLNNIPANWGRSIYISNRRIAGSAVTP